MPRNSIHVPNMASRRSGSVALYVALVLVLGLCTTSPLLALDPQKAITQYQLASWSRQNGLPANTINVVLQTRDGYLWLGTAGTGRSVAEGAGSAPRRDYSALTATGSEESARIRKMPRTVPPSPRCANPGTAASGSVPRSTACAASRMGKSSCTERMKGSGVTTST